MTRRILLIDDQDTIHEDYRKVLAPQNSASAALDKVSTDLFGEASTPLVHWDGFDLDSAFQGREGLELVQKSLEEGRPYSMAFVDIRMPPGWDGVQTVNRIWEVDPEILIVICSAYSDYTWEDMVNRLGRNDRFLVLKKPFDNIEVRQSAMVLTERWNVSRTDVLTGLLNRRAFQEHLKLEWTRAQRYGLPLACAMLDLDYFKRINDLLGHAAGDHVLKSVAECLQTQSRACDCISRHGGEEICILLPHTHEAGAAAWAENARQAIASIPVTIGDQSLEITASFGVAERLPGADTIEQFIERADRSLLVAKREGRDRVVRYSEITEPLDSEAVEAHHRNCDWLQNLKASQIVSSPVLCLESDATVGCAIDLWLSTQTRSAPVVDKHGNLVGMLSENDVAEVLLDDKAWSLPIRQIMQRNAVHYGEDTPARTIYEFLMRGAVPHATVVRDKRPTGVISRSDFLQSYRARFAPRAASQMMASI